MLKKNKRSNQKQNYDNKLLNKNTPFAITEAFKTLRTNLYYTSNNEACPVFAITSAYAHAGKSIIISNTALSYAQLDKKVLLIDADMRCPVINKMFELKSSDHGLSELLASPKFEPNDLESFIINSGIYGLDIITSGRIPPNPSELLSSKRINELLVFAKQNYDYIFIDLPPICEVADAGVIASLVTGYLFAVRAGTTDTQEVADGLEALRQTGANVIGFVLNDVNLKSSKKYYKYGKYGYNRSYAAAKEEQDKESK